MVMTIDDGTHRCFQNVVNKFKLHHAKPQNQKISIHSTVKVWNQDMLADSFHSKNEWFITPSPNTHTYTDKTH
jgi:hypothetical protein